MLAKDGAPRPALRAAAPRAAAIRSRQRPRRLRARPGGAAPRRRAVARRAAEAGADAAPLRGRDRHGQARARPAARLRARAARPAGPLRAGQIEIALTADAEPTCRRSSAQALQAWTGERWMVAVSQAEAGARPSHEARKRTARVAARRGARRSAGAEVLERFPGAEIVERARARAPQPSGRRRPTATPAIDRTTPIDERRRGLTMRDFLGMMKQAKELQEKMQGLQAEIAALEATGSVRRRPRHGDGRRQGRPEDASRSTPRSPSRTRSRSWRT